MKQFSDRAYSRMFLVSAIWNLYLSLGSIFMPELSVKLGFGADAVPTILNNYYTYTFYNFMSASVLVFGIGYYIVSRDVNKNHGIVLIGIIGKLVFFVYYTIAYFTSHCTVLMFLAVLGDFIFSIMFIYFLVQKRKSDAQD
jgi:hypothetical protein